MKFNLLQQYTYRLSLSDIFDLEKVKSCDQYCFHSSPMWVVVVVLSFFFFFFVPAVVVVVVVVVVVMTASRQLQVFRSGGLCVSFFTQESRPPGEK